MLTHDPQTAEPSLRLCTHCGSVWISSDPAAGRHLQSCPHECHATVTDYAVPWVQACAPVPTKRMTPMMTHTLLSAVNGF